MDLSCLPFFTSGQLLLNLSYAQLFSSTLCYLAAYAVHTLNIVIFHSLCILVGWVNSVFAPALKESCMETSAHLPTTLVLHVYPTVAGTVSVIYCYVCTAWDEDKSRRFKKVESSVARRKLYKSTSEHSFSGFADVESEIRSTALEK